MTSSSRGKRPAGADLLSDLLAALDPDLVTGQVMRPIQWAMQTFSCSETERASPDQFLEIAGRFLCHLYRHGRHVAMQLSEREAKAMALELLEAHYEGSLGPVYAGAMLDAIRPAGPGLEAVLTGLAQIVARREIERRAAAVLVRLVNPADWSTQRMLVEELVSCLGPSLPAHLADRSLDSLVSAYGELVRLFLQAQGFLRASQPPPKLKRHFRFRRYMGRGNRRGGRR